MAKCELVSQQLQQLAKQDYGRLLSLLIKYCQDICLAEDALQHAFSQALLSWQNSDLPMNPQGWLYRVAINFLLNSVKAKANLNQPLDEHDFISVDDENTLGDNRLELMFTCAHPAIDRNLHAPLMLQVVLGISVNKIAEAFVIPASRLAQQLVRVKRKIKQSQIGFELPEPEMLPSRLSSVLDAIYGCYAIDWLQFNAVKNRETLAEEALFLANLLITLMPRQAEACGLAALICFSHARAKSRFDDKGAFVPFEKQNPKLWDKALLEQGEYLLQQAFANQTQGRYQLEAAIQSAHCHRLLSGKSNWQQIEFLYQGLLKLAPSLGAEVSQALVIEKTRGSQQALDYLNQIKHAHIQSFQPALLAYAELYTNAGQAQLAADYYKKAIELTTDSSQSIYLQNKLSHLIFD